MLRKFVGGWAKFPFRKRLDIALYKASVMWIPSQFMWLFGSGQTDPNIKHGTVGGKEKPEK